MPELHTAPALSRFAAFLGSNSILDLTFVGTQHISICLKFYWVCGGKGKEGI